MRFQNLDLDHVELEQEGGESFWLPCLSELGAGGRLQPQRFAVPTGSALLFRALITGYRKQAKEIAELRSRLAEPRQPSKGKAKGRRVAA